MAKLTICNAIIKLKRATKKSLKFLIVMGEPVPEEVTVVAKITDVGQTLIFGKTNMQISKFADV